MGYRKFQSDQLFTGYELLNGGYVVITDDQGEIEDIVQEQDAGDNIQKFRGLISPGFINCHCHLELSHLKNVIPPHTGLIEFLCSVVTKRSFDAKTIQDEIVKGEIEMHENGIVAVGDIGNTADTVEVKSKSEIRWHNFVEILGFTDEKAEENVAHYHSVLDTFNKIRNPKSEIRNSLVPHAPYSISPKTFKLINELTKNQTISVHNQEHPAEDELYKTGGGEYLKLFKLFGVNQSPFPVTGKSSVRSYLPYFDHGQTIFLVHNTYMPEEDIVWANEYAVEHGLKLIYCLCPNANLYIENRLPPIALFIKHRCTLVLGTDSYSSNWQLSIAKEIQGLTTMAHFERVASLQTALQWATINGATALQWDDDLGSFEKGKTPGVVVIDTTNWTSRRLI
ncbi:MAG TPA: amidohydrolase family protein [Chitinophagaceae bacterium]|nr:amidohydrolase family protein [Chitinophagaceae bacterium]